MTAAVSGLHVLLFRAMGELSRVLSFALRRHEAPSREVAAAAAWLDVKFALLSPPTLSH